MAFTASAIFRQFVADTLAGTAVFDLDSPTDLYKVALYNNTGTPSKDVTAANSAYTVDQWVVGNEVTGTNWSAGGVALGTSSGSATVMGTTTITTPASGVIQWTSANTSSAASTTVSGTYGCLIYNNTKTTPVSKPGVCYNYFGGSNGVTGGVLTIVWNATNGIFRITV